MRTLAPSNGFDSEVRKLTGTDVLPEQPPAAPPTAAPAKRTLRQMWRQMPESTKRLLLIAVGVFVLVVSVLGFHQTSAAFDDRNPVLVAVRTIEPGETLSAADLSSALLLLEPPVPHIPWTDEAAFDFEGKVAVQPIPAGALVRHDMVIEAETAPVGVQLEVVVPLDLSLATEGVSEGEIVLLVDPGVEPVEGDAGRPRQVVREFKTTNFDGSRMRLFLPPEEWAQWEALLAEVGETLMVKDLGIGADPAETTQRLDDVWAAQWSAAVDQIEQAAAAAQPVAGPGELEVIVSLDASMVPSGVAEGDLVLLIDPGIKPDGALSGRARSVIQTLELENYADGQMRLFVPPNEWVRWQEMPEKLGGTPMVLPVPEGTDVDDMITQLDAEWRAAWQRAVAQALRPGGRTP